MTLSTFIRKRQSGWVWLAWLEKTRMVFTILVSLAYYVCFSSSSCLCVPRFIGILCTHAFMTSNVIYLQIGKVEKQVSWSRKYIVQWPDGSHQEQEVHHLYGVLTRKRPLRIGDHVIALADQSESYCYSIVYTL